jgi:hypothetical protein
MDEAIEIAKVTQLDFPQVFAYCGYLRARPVTKGTSIIKIGVEPHNVVTRIG